MNKLKQCDKKVLNINQINTLIKASKGSKVYMQVLFATSSYGRPRSSTDVKVDEIFETFIV